MKESNIIAIHNTCVAQADAAFKDFMTLTEKEMNDRSVKDASCFKGISAAELEKMSCAVMKEVALSTPFHPDEINLISGHIFPDIVAGKFYGVEVKSTVKDHWTSTGSSIVESTRDEFVEKIYMLFGNLGAKTPSFKCRPYQDVLSDIAVTHSPRYLIDMNLKNGETIFDKMGVDYDSFRTSGKQIEKARGYFTERAQKSGRKEMPWWISSSDVDKASSFNIRMWNSLSQQERAVLLAKCLILFPETMCSVSSITKYNNAVLWLCSYCQVVSSCFRDDFSAGGKITKVDDVVLKTPLPRVFKTIVDSADIVKNLLKKPDEEMLELIKAYNPSLIKDPYGEWLKYCKDIGGDDLVDWIKSGSRLE